MILPESEKLIEDRKNSDSRPLTMQTEADERHRVSPHSFHEQEPSTINPSDDNWVLLELNRRLNLLQRKACDSQGTDELFLPSVRDDLEAIREIAIAVRCCR